jgi:hypothetical protein
MTALTVVYLVTVAVCVGVLVWHLVTRSRPCQSRRTKCRCVSRGRHSQHRCGECSGSWRDGEVGIKFGGDWTADV